MLTASKEENKAQKANVLNNNNIPKIPPWKLHDSD